MNKKGQITIFIIVGIVLLIAFGLIFFLKGKVFKASEDIFDTKTESIETYVWGCVESVSENAVYYVGTQGGYANIPAPKMRFYWREIPYYMYENKNTMPTKETIEKEISKFIDYWLPVCLDNLSIFKEQGYDIEIGDISSKAYITLDEVFIDVDYPIEIKKEDYIKNLEKFNAQVPVRLNLIYDTIYNLTEEQLKDQQHICLSCFTQKNVDNDFYIETNIQQIENTIIFTLIDRKSVIYNQTYMFVYAYKYVVENENI